MQNERLRLVTMLVTIAPQSVDVHLRIVLRFATVRCRFVRYRQEVVNIFQLTRVQLFEKQEHAPSSRRNL